MPKMVLTLCKLRYMVVNLVISHIRTSLALLGILCPSGVCLVQNDTFTDVLSYKLGKIVVYGESVSGCVCVHVCACEHGSMRVYVHLQFYRIMPVFSCWAFEAVCVS